MSSLCKSVLLGAGLALVLFFAEHNETSADKKHPPVEPLPEGALLRLDGPSSAAEFNQSPVGDRRIVSLAFLPDGKQVTATDHSGCVRIWDGGTGKESQTFRAPSAVLLANRAIQVALDPPPGNPLDAAADTRAVKPSGMVIRETPSGKRLSRFSLKVVPETFAASRDSRLLITASSEDQGIRIYDIFRGYVLHRLPGPSGWFRGWGALGGQFGISVRSGSLQAGKLNALAFSPDGRTLAGCWNETFRLWDVQTGRLRRSFGSARPEQLWGGEAMVFSRDSNSLAAARNGFLRLWEVRTGKLRTSMKIHRGILTDFCLALSPDQRMLAVTPANTRTIDLYDLFTGSCQHTFRAGQPVMALAFSPDGKLLASGDKDGSVLLWDMEAVEKALPPPAAPLSTRDLEQAWKNLADANATRTYRAIATLAQSPKQSVPFLKRQMKPVPAERGHELAGLIADLDSPRYPIRETAEKRLIAWGSQAELALLDVLAKRPSLEVRRRIERILAKVDAQPVYVSYLRELRAVEALECAGTPEARDVLAMLARGGAGVGLTREAAAALERLNHRLTKP
jgi:WD40 repeat protein